MIILLHGDDYSKSRKYISKIAEKLSANIEDDISVNKDEIDLTDLTPEQLVEKLNSFGLFNDAPMLIANISGLRKSIIEKYIPSFEKISQKATLILITDKALAKSHVLIKNAKKIGINVQENPLKITSNIFKLIDAVFEKNRKKTYRELEQISKTEDPFYIFTMLLYGLRNVATVKFNEISKEKMNSYMRKKTESQEKLISDETFKKIYKKAYIYDRDLKTGKITPDLAITLLIEKVLTLK